MRYTTIIDLTEFPSLYKSDSVRLVYLHLALRSGYHDHDRDLIGISIRSLAKETGLTVSAVRCALKRLDGLLITRQGPLYYVKKWVVDSPITPRPRTEKQKKRLEEKALEEQEREQRMRRLQIEEQKREFLRSQGKTQFMIYYEDLQRKAAAGDTEAAQLVKNHATTYKLHQQQLKQDKQK